MKKSCIALILAVLMLAACFAGCSKDKADDEEAKKLLDAVSEASGKANDTSSEEDESLDSSITIDEGTAELPTDGIGLQAAVELIEWWCAPSSKYEESTEKRYQYDGIIKPDGDRSYSFSFGSVEDGDFVPERYFGVSVDGQRIYELNLVTVEYSRIYDSDSSSNVKTSFTVSMYQSGVFIGDYKAECTGELTVASVVKAIGQLTGLDLSLSNATCVNGDATLEFTEDAYFSTKDGSGVDDQFARDSSDEQSFDLLDSILNTCQNELDIKNLYVSTDGDTIGGVDFGGAYGIDPSEPYTGSHDYINRV